MRIDGDLVAAPAAPLVLAIVAGGERHGYEIIKDVRELSGGELAWADAMIYPLFHRLSRVGYLTTQWRPLPEGRRKYSAITEDGLKALARRSPRAEGRAGLDIHGDGRSLLLGHPASTIGMAWGLN